MWSKDWMAEILLNRMEHWARFEMYFDMSYFQWFSHLCIKLMTLFIALIWYLMLDHWFHSFGKHERLIHSSAMHWMYHKKFVPKMKRTSKTMAFHFTQNLNLIQWLSLHCIASHRIALCAFYEEILHNFVCNWNMIWSFGMSFFIFHYTHSVD